MKNLNSHPNYTFPSGKFKSFTCLKQPKYSTLIDNIPCAVPGYRTDEETCRLWSVNPNYPMENSRGWALASSQLKIAWVENKMIDRVGPNLRSLRRSNHHLVKKLPTLCGENGHATQKAIECCSHTCQCCHQCCPGHSDSGSEGSRQQSQSKSTDLVNPSGQPNKRPTLFIEKVANEQGLLQKRVELREYKYSIGR